MAAEGAVDAAAQARFGMATTITIVSVATVAGCIGDDEPEEEEVELPPTDSDGNDFPDLTGQDTVEIDTRWGGAGESEFVFDPAFVRVDQGTMVRWGPPQQLHLPLTTGC